MLLRNVLKSLLYLGLLALLGASWSCVPKGGKGPEFVLESLPTNPWIRVCIEENATATSLSLGCPYEVRAGYRADVLGGGESLSAATVEPVAGGIRIAGQVYPIAFIRLRPKGEANFSINGKPYRGDLHIFRTVDNTLFLINYLPLEDYLYGVVCGEMPEHWPIEALEAQAVAARSWALNRVMLKKDAVFDVHDDQRSQVYGGIAEETDGSREAVDNTRGQVLVYDNKLIPTYYSSMCGGQTESGALIFKEPAIPPLQGVSCPYCRMGAPADKFNWKRTIAPGEFGKAFAAKAKIDTVEYFRIQRARPVHADAITVQYDGGKSLSIDAMEFRKALALRSTGFVTLTVNQGGYEFTGVGFGHGVGLCQWGAYAMAVNRRPYDEILKFYYPGARIAGIPGLKS